MLDFKVTLKVLGYREDGEWVALALDMDLRGYGDTFQEAASDLQSQIAMQLSYSLHKTGSLDMAFRKAENKWLALFEQDHMDALRNAVESDYYIIGLPMLEAHVIEAMKGQYSANHA